MLFLLRRGNVALQQKKWKEISLLSEGDIWFDCKQVVQGREMGGYRMNLFPEYDLPLEALGQENVHTKKKLCIKKRQKKGRGNERQALVQVHNVPLANPRWTLVLDYLSLFTIP